MKVEVLSYPMPTLIGRIGTIVEANKGYDPDGIETPWYVHFDFDNTKRQIVAKNLKTAGVVQDNLAVVQKQAKRMNKK